MIDHNSHHHSEEIGDFDSMGIENGAIYLSSSSTIGRRPSILSQKFRLREERKKVLRISSTKYHNIEDHETGMRRFCLIKNTLQHLQRETREEKLARHNAKANNVSPSYLSASRPRSPSPTNDIEDVNVINTYGPSTLSPNTSLSGDDDEVHPTKRHRLQLDDDYKGDDKANSHEDEPLPSKRSRLHLNNNIKEDDKENLHEDLLIDVVGDRDSLYCMNATQSSFREVYDECTGDSTSQYHPSSLPLSTKVDSQHNSGLCCNTSDHYINTPSSYNYSLSTIVNCNSNQSSCSSNFNERCLSLSGCRHSAFLGNDLQSVVYQSLITSL